MMDALRPRPSRHLVLGTLSFTICFAAWGLISAFAPAYREALGLSASQTALLVAIPVLLGSLGRIPMGMLTDRLGGRGVFAVLMASVAIPIALIPRIASYRGLLLVAFCLGMAGSSFVVGVGYVSRWFSMERQGSALGVYGLGNVGHSLAVFLGPVLAVVVGRNDVFYGLAVLLVAWAIVFAVFARNAPDTPRPKSARDMVTVLAHAPLSWALSAFYFLTFGGFVAFSVYLPSLLQEQFALTPADAGFRTAGFVVLATAVRPLGGWLADMIGGARVLSAVFVGVGLFSLVLAWPAILPFTVGALGCAVLLGIGNGAVFQLVPRYFPQERATVTGLVGAVGGMGGFFPPLLLGLFLDSIGVVWPGFLLLSATAWLLWWINHRVFVPRQEAFETLLSPELTRTADRFRAGAWATLWSSVLVGAIVVGSRNLQNFDAALVIYTFAVIFAIWGVVYHYSVWLQKPPTRVYWQRGWELFHQRGVIRSLGKLLALFGSHLLAQTFIRRRSTLRWAMHQLLFWGCLLAVAITFPLVFGWIHFTSAPDNQMVYVAYLFGFPVASFPLGGFVAWISFNGLNISAVLVLSGIVLALWRRMRDKGAIAVQNLSMDFFPLILLFAISVTGLALTVSQHWLGGSFYQFMSIFHAITVIAALLYLPFGKFFHIFQRPAQLGVKLYQHAGEGGEAAVCSKCGEQFASRMHIEDLKKILPQMGFDYRMSGAPGHWQDLCPACKRRSLSAVQLRMQEESRGETPGF